MLDEQEITEETTEEVTEEVKEESLEDKVARLEASNTELTKTTEDAVDEKKRLLEEKSQLGRRTRDAEDRQIEFDRKLADMQKSINSSSARAVNYEGQDLTDPDVLNRIIDERVDQGISTKISSDGEAQKRYSQDYEREVRNLEDGLGDKLKEDIRFKLETFKDYHTGDPKTDAKINFLEARNTVQESMISETRKPINLKQDTLEGAGVGGKGSSDTGKAKTVQLGKEEQRLKEKLGMSDESVKKALA